MIWHCRDFSSFNNMGNLLQGGSSRRQFSMEASTNCVKKTVAPSKEGEWMYTPMACTTTRAGHREDLMWSWKDVFSIDSDRHVLNLETKIDISGWERKYSFSSKHLCDLLMCVYAFIRLKSTKWVRTPMNKNLLPVQVKPLALHCALRSHWRVCLVGLAFPTVQRSPSRIQHLMISNWWWTTGRLIIPL